MLDQYEPTGDRVEVSIFKNQYGEPSITLTDLISYLKEQYRSTPDEPILHFIIKEVIILKNSQ